MFWTPTVARNREEPLPVPRPNHRVLLFPRIPPITPSILSPFIDVFNQGDLDLPATFSGFVLMVVWAPILIVHFVFNGSPLNLGWGLMALLVGFWQLYAVTVSRKTRRYRERCWSALAAAATWCGLAIVMILVGHWLCIGAGACFLAMMLACLNGFRRFLPDAL